ncbi:MAG: hypothetical protein PHS46_04600 [Candidatus Omnitrophica bacterium]|nr:hypothetical protein [Candidatus Omnitrophota bacterium]
MQRVRYEVDPYNRLVIADDGSTGDLPKFRQAIDGQFKLDEYNNLSYRVKAPLSEGDDIPHQVDIGGSWRLGDKHELRLAVEQASRKTFGDEITLQGDILDVDKNSLLFSITTRTKAGGRSTYIMALKGVWKADENNRLSFYARRENGNTDALVFNGAWEINKNHQIVYRYEKTHELVFKGHWDIKEKFRLTYLMDVNSSSAFEFKVGAGVMKEDYIAYEAGIGFQRGLKKIKKRITLYGAWKLKKDTGLVFEIEYESGEFYSILFGADCALGRGGVVSFKLKEGVSGRDLGMSVKLSRDILGGDGELFMRALASRRELAVYAGAAWRF